jgi:exopolysaccharide biosynthesis WecB/TagA/CpsF family protein
VDPLNGNGKRNVLGVLVDVVDYESATERVLNAARNEEPMAVSALAVHGVMTGVFDRSQRYRLNHLDMVTPDGQPVRWALNILHKADLAAPVAGPELSPRLCEAAAREGLPIYFYGSNQETLDKLQENLRRRYPGLVIAGAEPSKFRTTSRDEKVEIAKRIRDSGAKIVFVGLGCPRQEIFAYEYRELLGMPVLAVGAAFDYGAGNLQRPPGWIQRHGLEWFVRLMQEPRRLWKRYLLLNPTYLSLLLLQKLRIWRPNPHSVEAPATEVLHG